MGNSDQLLNALAGGRRTAEDVELVWAAAQRWLENGCMQPMHRFLRLPPTPGKLTKATRDLWLRRASLLIDAESTAPTVKARNLLNELEKFITRGPWQSWRDLAAPPDSCSALRKALFYATKYHAGKLLSEWQIYRILA